MDHLEATFFPQGRVDAILLQTGGQAVFIDSGFRLNGLRCIEQMRRMGVTKLDAYIGTHGHKNHIGGAGAIIRAMRPNAVYIPHDRVREAFIKHAAKGAEREAAREARYVIVRAHDRIELGDAVLTCLGPLKIKNCSPGAYAENANSLILRVDYGARSMLLTGDTSSAILNAVHAKSPGVLMAEVLKNAHHSGALPLATLKRIDPDTVVVCNGGPPSLAYQKRVAGIGAKMYTAGKKGDGRVTLMTTGDGWVAIMDK